MFMKKTMIGYNIYFYLCTSTFFYLPPQEKRKRYEMNKNCHEYMMNQYMNLYNVVI